MRECTTVERHMQFDTVVYKDMLLAVFVSSWGAQHTNFIMIAQTRYQIRLPVSYFMKVVPDHKIIEVGVVRQLWVTAAQTIHSLP